LCCLNKVYIDLYNSHELDA